MKFKRIVLMILLLLLGILNEKITVFAMNTGFSTEALSDEQKKTFLSNVNISSVDSVTQKRGIECFDVNDEGLIAIGFSDSERKTVAVYNSEGVFQYGYKFRAEGIFGLE